MLAYVWPAVAVDVAEPVISLLTALAGSAGIPTGGLAGLPRLLGVAGLIDAVDPLPKQSAAAGKPPSSSPRASLPGDEMSLLATLLIGFLIAMGLVALARLLVGEELFEPRRWRSHRGL